MAREPIAGQRELPPPMPPTDEVVRLARLQAIFYIVTGVWPFVSMRSFEAVTGPKVDRWLVKTVGALVAVIGCALALANRRISPVYLLDAIAEIALLAGWARLFGQSSHGSRIE